MLADKRGKQLEGYVPCYVVFDLETTGISASYDDIIEISAVKVENGKVIDEFSSLVNPGRPIPAAATVINGISNTMVAQAPSFAEILPEFLRFIGDNVLVGHNINSFDMKFIYREVDRYYPGKTLDNDCVDTLPLARHTLTGLTSHKLTNLAEHYRISSAGAHRALNDCRMNQQVYERLCEDWKKGGDKEPDKKTCPKCGYPMKRRKGRYGEFWGCSSFPKCRYTENI